MAFSASGLVFTNHCVEISGSTTVLQRSHLPSAERVGLDFFEQAQFFEIGHDALARFEAVEARRRGRRRRSCCASSPITWICGRLWRLPGFEIVGIVRGSDFHHAGAEFRVGDFVEDDRDLAIHQRQRDGLPCRS